MATTSFPGKGDWTTELLNTTVNATNTATWNSSSTEHPGWGLYWHIVYYSLLMPVGFFGNLLTLVVVGIIVTHRKSIPDVLLGSLAVCDMFSILAIHPLSIAATAYNDWVFGWLGCVFQSVMTYTYFKIGFLLKIVISGDRFLALTRPLKYRHLVTIKRLKITNVIIVLFSLLTSIITPLVEPDLIQILPTWFLCIDHFDRKSLYVTMTIGYISLIFVVGMITFIVSNIAITKALLDYRKNKPEYLSDVLAHWTAVTNAERETKTAPVVNGGTSDNADVKIDTTTTEDLELQPIPAESSHLKTIPSESSHLKTMPVKSLHLKIIPPESSDTKTVPYGTSEHKTILHDNLERLETIPSEGPDLKLILDKSLTTLPTQCSDLMTVPSESSEPKAIPSENLAPKPIPHASSQLTTIPSECSELKTILAGSSDLAITTPSAGVSVSREAVPNGDCLCDSEGRAPQARGSGLSGASCPARHDTEVEKERGEDGYQPLNKGATELPDPDKELMAPYRYRTNTNNLQGNEIGNHQNGTISSTSLHTNSVAHGAQGKADIDLSTGGLHGHSKTRSKINRPYSNDGLLQNANCTNGDFPGIIVPDIKVEPPLEDAFSDVKDTRLEVDSVENNNGSNGPNYIARKQLSSPETARRRWQQLGAKLSSSQEFKQEHFSPNFPPANSTVQRQCSDEQEKVDCKVVTFKVQKKVEKLAKTIRRKTLRKRNEIVFARLVLIMAIVFSVIWIPYAVFIILNHAKIYHNHWAEDAGIKIVFFNAFLNPVLYGLFKANYRKGYWYLLKMTFYYMTFTITEKPVDDNIFYEKKKTLLKKHLKAARMNRLDSKNQMNNNKGHVNRAYEPNASDDDNTYSSGAKYNKARAKRASQSGARSNDSSPHTIEGATLSIEDEVEAEWLARGDTSSITSSEDDSSVNTSAPKRKISSVSYPGERILDLSENKVICNRYALYRESESSEQHRLAVSLPQSVVEAIGQGGRISTPKLDLRRVKSHPPSSPRSRSRSLELLSHNRPNTYPPIANDR